MVRETVTFVLMILSFIGLDLLNLVIFANDLVYIDCEQFKEQAGI